ncbi:RNA degradosome polyphosphate kinase [Vallitalea longa]|uniref:Polyphosphate kinase n=1 Tax=Vallitalea longa TaxID=2936439 RepID=A0A9W5Y955_9FIRM|nr:RNA degradosome polyphosphate kinase [Vallitalea longa]GKX28371.1 RNA degradosome polyphosphate kinase [Vallitalea longa]
MVENTFDNPLYFENRELSWLEFNQRVLDEAKNSDNPLFERIKFMSIVSSNLDEFIMVRVASLKEQLNVGYNKPDISGLTQKQQLKRISARTHKLVDEQYSHYKRSIVPHLKTKGINLIHIKDLNDKQKNYLEEYFTEVIYPVLTPLAVDSSRPFPLILNKSLNLAILIKRSGEEVFATVQVPAVLSRFIEIPNNGNKYTDFILLEDVMKLFMQRLFVGFKVICTYPYRITRNADLSIDEEDTQDLLIEIEKSVKKRKWGEAIRLEVSDDMDERLINILKKSLTIHNKDIYYINGPLDLTFLMKLYDLKGFNHLKYDNYTPSTPKDLLGEEDIFEVIRKRDVFLHHPYESFTPVVSLIKKAAADEKVLAIKQTLYRVSGQSPIIKALAEAAESGKQVTVLVELKARFDEENNIQWARRLEKSGCHVIYGLVGLKTHCKITLIVRMEEDGIRRYVHLGTGNYNDITAKLYTDMGILTCNEKIGADTSAVFNTLSGYSEPPKLNKLTMAPTGLRKKFMMLIEREANNAILGKKSKIIVKMNSICDPGIMKALYKASSAGVEIELIVRGICDIIPCIDGVSDNITVRSIVGRYLEHSRIFYFYNDKNEEVYLSSADWMPRNLNRRVELMFPIEDQRIKERIIDILKIMLKDNVKAKTKDRQGEYVKINKKGKKILNSQEYFAKTAQNTMKEYTVEKEHDIFIPITKDNK